MPQRKRTAATAFLAANPDPAPSIDESATLRADSTAEPPKRQRAAAAPADGGIAVPAPAAEVFAERRKALLAERGSQAEGNSIPVEELRGMGHEELARYAFAIGKQARPGADLRAVKCAVEAPAAEGKGVGLVGDPVLAAAVAGELDGFESESGEGKEDEDDEDDVEGDEGGNDFEDGNEDEDEDEESVDARWTRRKITGWIPTSPPPKLSASQKARRRYRSRKRARRDAEQKLKTVAASA